ncbi:MAG TPA: nucleotidyltransferase, partial [Veillonellaceae bacterium]|nr:nucleotidyltransferase [Veillonellaceae bacterium]
MGNREKAIGELLSKIADELNITSTMQDKAVQSYHAVGDWIGRGIDYDVKIMPQGSMNLGTIIKPIDDSDDYDIDLVCLLEDGQQLEAEKIKEIIGDRLKNNTTYKMKMRREGKRCWTLDYEEFH